MHSFAVHQLPNNVMLMVCKCGMTYRYSTTAESWYEVSFRNSVGAVIEAPEGACGPGSEMKQPSAPCIGCGRVVTEGVEVMIDPITHKLQCVCKECEKEL